MAKRFIDDELWELVRRLLPERKPPRISRYPGRPPLDDRRCLEGIVFVLKTGIPWEDLPQEMGCGSGMTCWRRLHAWHEAGVWDKLHRLLLARLRAADKIDWTRAVADSSLVRAVGAGEKDGPQSNGSRASWQQAPSAHRRRRRPFGRLLDGCESPRRHAADRSG